MMVAPLDLRLGKDGANGTSTNAERRLRLLREPRTTNHEPRTTNRELRIANCELRDHTLIINDNANRASWSIH
jgi:hypothetical protein